MYKSFLRKIVIHHPDNSTTTINKGILDKVCATSFDLNVSNLVLSTLNRCLSILLLDKVTRYIPLKVCK